ncbi:hypothetical protein WH50_21090 [Pokkaliibacter plantistimulans]|uniref:Small secreted protein n=1 Tax=Pokkaliibacter plantistimulans TaxID=1635171 RepID=A0ABX5LXG5_9GAMM|nr:hypothetical protein [Pokkaliibacter plantistimulans]PXF29385.1 hypothetical protein WH50_21090 [Pokkaliibacter plantistimulans]
MPGLRRTFTVIALSSLMTLGLAACDSDDGPAEQLGEKIDNAVTSAGNAVEDSCEQAKQELGASDTRC